MSHNGMTPFKPVLYHEYTCHRCDVTWRAGTDENIPDTCWNCEKTDETTVAMQCGRPVTFRQW